jgi:diacylglycerol kinase
MVKFLKKFYFASRGIIVAAQTETTVQIHLAIAILVIILGIILQVSLADFVIFVLLIGMVIGSEMLNTSIERVCDILRDKYQLPYNGSTHIRDIAGGAVWIQAIAAAIIGILIFSKYLN